MTNNPNQNTNPSQKTPGSSQDYQGGSDQAKKQGTQPDSNKQTSQSADNSSKSGTC